MVVVVLCISNVYKVLLLNNRICALSIWSISFLALLFQMKPFYKSQSFLYSLSVYDSRTTFLMSFTIVFCQLLLLATTIFFNQFPYTLECFWSCSFIRTISVNLNFLKSHFVSLFTMFIPFFGSIQSTECSTPFKQSCFFWVTLVDHFFFQHTHNGKMFLFFGNFHNVFSSFLLI